jgi:hypothetical protein
MSDNKMTSKCQCKCGCRSHSFGYKYCATCQSDLEDVAAGVFLDVRSVQRHLPLVIRGLQYAGPVPVITTK